MSAFRLSLLSVLSASVLTAQGTPPHPHEEPIALESFIITAHPYGGNQAELAQATTVLSGTGLALKQASSLGELLGSEPGISSTYFGPGASRPVIRGLGGDRVRILENSVGLIDASVTSPDHAVALDPLLTESIEVVRGPAALLYGNSAVGGVVNVITHRIHTTPPESALNGRAELRASSVNGETAGGMLFEGASGAVAWHLDGYRRSAGDVRIPGFAESALLRAEEAAEAAEHGEDPPEEIAGHIPNTGVVAEGGAVGLSLVNDRGHLGFAFTGHNSLYGVPSGAHHHHGDEEESHEEEGHEHDAHGDESAVRIDLRQRRVELQGGISGQFGLLTGARFSIGAARYRHQELEGAEVGTVFTNRGYDGRAELLHGPVGAFSGAIGLQTSASRFSAVGDEAFVPSNKSSSHALFLFEEAVFGPAKWQLGGRVEEQRIRLDAPSGASRREVTMSASTGLVWTLSSDWTIGSSFAFTERAPNAQELFSHGPHVGTGAFEIGDPLLTNESSVALDLSLRRRTGWVTGALTVFANRFDGYIHDIPTGELEDGLEVYTYVQRDADFHGAELEAILHLHESDRHQFDLQLGGDIVRGRNRDERIDLPRITPARVRAGFTWITGPFSFGAQVQRVMTQEQLAPGERETPGYTLISASAGYRLSVGRVTWDLFLRGTNLTDEEARVHTSFLKEIAPLPGRNLTLGLRTSF